MSFVLVSAGVHAALVITSSSSTSITLPSSKGSVMNINIQEKKNILVQNVITKPLSNNTVVENLQQKILPEITKKAQSLEKQVKVSNKKPTNKTIVLVDENKQAKSKAHVISVIYKELNQYFVYPKLARKHNWQGKVLLSLRVNTNGEINNVHIYTSSGYSILDQAAINALMKVKHLPKLSSWLPGDVNLKLPVIYKLTEG